MSTHTVIVIEPTRARKWIQAIGTSTVPVKSATPVEVTIGTGKQFLTRPMYEVDVKALSLKQQAGLIQQKAQEWECPIDDARALINQIGIGIIADHCTAAPMPNMNREPRKGEIEVSQADTHDTCKSCGAAILWHKFPNGPYMPLSIRTIEQDAGGRRFALSHFADCPNAKVHRRRGTTAAR